MTGALPKFQALCIDKKTIILLTIGTRPEMLVNGGWSVTVTPESQLISQFNNPERMKAEWMLVQFLLRIQSW